MKLLVATTNPGKLGEYRDMFTDLAVEWVSLRDVGLADMDVEETGTTFEENARLKADAYCRASGLVTLADDSGLVVDALNGEPGVYSARYGAPSAQSDQDRYTLLLSKLAGVPDAQRSARFVCVVAVAAPHTATITAQGALAGSIGYAPRGTNGFGYDPIVIIPDGRTVAELPPAEKHAISHRGNALRAIHDQLIAIIQNQ